MAINLSEKPVIVEREADHEGRILYRIVFEFTSRHARRPAKDGNPYSS